MAALSHAWVLSHDCQRRLCLLCEREDVFDDASRSWALFKPGCDECDAPAPAPLTLYGFPVRFTAPEPLTPELRPWAAYLATLDLGEV